MMDKNLLKFLSLGVAAALILLSLNSVVGFQAAKSKVTNNSPLYKLQLDKTIDNSEKKTGMTFTYLKKDDIKTLATMLKLNKRDNLVARKVFNEANIKNVINLLKNNPSLLNRFVKWAKRSKDSFRVNEELLSAAREVLNHLDSKSTGFLKSIQPLIGGESIILLLILLILFIIFVLPYLSEIFDLLGFIFFIIITVMFGCSIPTGHFPCPPP
ncbi:MAG: hypothetical protein J7J89_06050 [Thermoplasmata archaeon]|nr:hypothetical protein [Thermoplasmata archaeon]